jgi:hypothetical protein
MSNSESEQWAKFSKLGRTQYVLRYGVLGWGVPTAILFSLIDSYRFGWEGFLSQIVPALVIFPVGGIFFGRCMWRLLENKHVQATAAGTK